MIQRKYSAYRLFARELKKRGFNVRVFTQEGRRFVTYAAPSGRAWTTPTSNLRYPFVSPEVRTIARDKVRSYELAAAAGMAIPYTEVVDAEMPFPAEKAKVLLDRYERLVVKPADSSLSRGITLNIADYDGLKVAIQTAKAVSPNILIQEQVEGEEVRFAVLNGSVVAALLRQTPRIVGDGVTTVKELIRRENKARKKLTFKYISYPQLTAAIIPEHFLTDASVLPAGEVLELSRATMIKNGCSVYNILPQVHPGYLSIVQTLAAVLEPSFMVVDLFLKDYKTAPAPGNHWFIEFNASPVLKLFFGCRDGKMVDLIPSLAEAIDRYLSSDAAPSDQ